MVVKQVVTLDSSRAIGLFGGWPCVKVKKGLLKHESRMKLDATIVLIITHY